jgi:hypothetical protein
MRVKKWWSVLIAAMVMVMPLLRVENADAHHPMRVDSWNNATLPGMDDTHTHADLDVPDSWYGPNGGYLGS